MFTIVYFLTEDDEVEAVDTATLSRKSTENDDNKSTKNDDSWKVNDLFFLVIMNDKVGEFHIIFLRK